MKCRFLRRENGSVAVEAGLLLPVVVGIMLVVVDLYLVARARADLERSTGTLSTILASQSELTSDGFDQLLSWVHEGTNGTYQVFVGQVSSDGDVKWALEAGNASNLCENPLETSPFQGELPESDDSDDDNDSDGSSDDVAMMFVQACQKTEALNLTSLVLNNEILKSISINRMRTADLELDEELRERAGLPEEDDENEAEED